MGARLVSYEKYLGERATKNFKSGAHVLFFNFNRVVMRDFLKIVLNY